VGPSCSPHEQILQNQTPGMCFRVRNMFFFIKHKDVCSCGFSLPTERFTPSGPPPTGELVMAFQDCVFSESRPKWQDCCFSQRARCFTADHRGNMDRSAATPTNVKKAVTRQQKLF
jgi:hypothetical protein